MKTEDFNSVGKCFETFCLRRKNSNNVYTLTENELLKILNKHNYKETKKRKNISLEVI